MYLESLWLPEAQQLAAKNFFRPTDPSVLAQYAKLFPAVEIFSVNQFFGHWDEINRKHFSDGALFDQFYQAKQAQE